MSASTHADTHDTHDNHGAGHGHDVDPAHIDPVTGEYNGPMFDSHDKQYLKIAAILAVITGVEIAASYMGLKGGALAAVLMSLGLVKFVIVAGEFMHLKFDTPLFKRLFVVGGVLAGFCYTAVLTAMGALKTPRALLPVHWWIYLIGSAVAIVIWVVPRRGSASADGGHDGNNGHDAHAATSH